MYYYFDTLLLPMVVMPAGSSVIVYVLVIAGKREMKNRQSCILMSNFIQQCWTIATWNLQTLACFLFKRF
jgi:hypothetical protein